MQKEQESESCAIFNGHYDTQNVINRYPWGAIHFLLKKMIDIVGGNQFPEQKYCSNNRF